jgi:hypothetical protein
MSHQAKSILMFILYLHLAQVFICLFYVLIRLFVLKVRVVRIDDELHRSD